MLEGLGNACYNSFGVCVNSCVVEGKGGGCGDSEHFGSVVVRCGIGGECDTDGGDVTLCPR